MKYIVIKQNHGSFEQEIPIIFPESLAHASVFEAMKNCEGLKNVEAVSAGEFSSLDFEANCHGSSFSLKLESRRLHDMELIRQNDYKHGVT